MLELRRFNLFGFRGDIMHELLGGLLSSRCGSVELCGVRVWLCFSRRRDSML